jgi:hypothetical protein
MHPLKRTGHNKLEHSASLTSCDDIQSVLVCIIYTSLVLITQCDFHSSRAVRLHWGHLVRTGVVRREYGDISINNVITLGTRIRITVLRVT